MVYPLIEHTQRSFGRDIYGQAILCKHSKAIGCDQLGNAVVDLGIDMVRATCKYNTATAVHLHIGKQFFSFRANIKSRSLLLLPSGKHSGSDLFFGNVPFLSANGNQSVSGDLFRGECHKRTDETNVTARDGFHVIL